MVKTLELMYFRQPEVLPGVLFRRRLTNLDYCRKLGYVPFDYPEDAQRIDIVCMLCGGVVNVNLFLDNPVCNC